MADRIVEGIIKKHRDGFGFLIPREKAAEDVYLPPSELRGVMDGDTLRVELIRRRGRQAGRLLEVVERGRRFLLGVYRVRRGHTWVEPLDASVGESVPVHLACDRPPKNGQIVKVAITEWPTAVSEARGEVIDVLGEPGDPMQAVLSIAYSKGFADAFPADVMEAADATPDRVMLEDFAGRRDLRDLPLVTIDGEDARDFDDAVFVERVPGGGFRLVVAIADVSHYVREGMPLDREALARGTSVYFPNLVLPMLPQRLSTGICSLNPGVDRLCMVADLTLTGDGKTVNTEIYEGVMRSHARLTYRQVAAMMGEVDDPVPEAHRAWQRQNLEPAVALSKKLHERRLTRGAIDLDLPEPYVVLDAEHRPVEFRRRERLWAHRLIEEFMLAANEAVAYFFAHRGLPTIYRVHDEPDEAKLEAFAAMAQTHGFSVVDPEDMSPKALAEFIRATEGAPGQRAMHTLLLRSLKQAVYSAENIGHFGLAAPHYLHFTSPIRRYPDLIVHRLLKAYWARAGRSLADGALAQAAADVERFAAESSERERAAMHASHEADDFFACLFMQDRVGETFPATVASVAEFGLFVELEAHAVEGLVRTETLGEDAEFVEERLELVFPRSGRRFTIGDGLQVVCTAVDVARRRIDFEPVAPEAGPARRRKRKGAGEAAPRRTRSAAEPKRGRKAEAAPAKGARKSTRRKTQEAESPPERTRRGRSGAKATGKPAARRTTRKGKAKAKPSRGRKPR